MSSALPAPAGSPDLPAWFADAVGTAYETGFAPVHGGRIGYRAWGSQGEQDVVLVHGGGAHAGWWDHIAPFLALGSRVVALDLSGHGSSDHRPSYGLAAWADEVLAVSRWAGLVRPAVVGHSMGGLVALRLGAEHGDAVAGVVAIDPVLRDISGAEAAERTAAARSARRRYPSQNAATARFRTLPAQENTLAYILDHIARGSLRETPGGWEWSFDPGVFDWTLDIGELIGSSPCRTALIRTEHGLLPAHVASGFVARRPGRTLVAELPAAGHHAMLDQPLSLVVGLRVLLAAWSA